MADQLVHEGISGTPQRRQVDPGGAEEFVRIGRAGMGRVEDNRRAPLRGLNDLEGWRLVAVKPGHFLRLRPLVSGFVPWQSGSASRYQASPLARSTSPAQANALIRPIGRLLCVVIVRNRNHPAKRKDEICAGTCLNPAGSEVGTGRYGSIASCRIPVHKSPAARAAEGKDFHPKFTLRRA